MPRLLVQFARYGPYHHARLRFATLVLAPLGWEVIGLETAGTDTTYAWKETKGATDFARVITAFPGRVHEEIKATECRDVLHTMLDERSPDAIAIAGWASPDALACLSWCRRNKRRRIVMSETREADGHRVWWKEWIKSQIIRRFDAALVGAKSHRNYLVKLGMPAERVAFGYNVVDNAYFAAEVARWRDRLSVVGCRLSENEATGLSRSDGARIVPQPPYFLASNRFIERKNLLRLVDAYATYLREVQTTDHRPPTTRPWNLCLLGDGEQKPALLSRCRELGLTIIESAPWEAEEKAESGKPTADIGEGVPDSSFQLSASSVSVFPSPTVFFPGFRQIDELPRFYAHAGCFIHPALEEPWGLVINEAMACGLPILSGHNVGAAEELVDAGVNGWTFDATNTGEMAEMMVRISSVDFPLGSFGAASERILEERCPTAAFGRGLAALLER